MHPEISYEVTILYIEVNVPTCKDVVFFIQYFIAKKGRVLIVDYIYL